MTSDNEQASERDLLSDIILANATPHNLDCVRVADAILAAGFTSRSPAAASTNVDAVAICRERAAHIERASVMLSRADQEVDGQRRLEALRCADLIQAAINASPAAAPVGVTITDAMIVAASRAYQMNDSFEPNAFGYKCMRDALAAALAATPKGTIE